MLKEGVNHARMCLNTDVYSRDISASDRSYAEPTLKH